ncbi:MAG: type II secretion system GspH family protein [Lachnospiraceae bacterium]|nr:type II secretion system GspH family protein [Lachnospiraceae bacterium]
MRQKITDPKLKGKMTGNGGFTLVEVLVCLALIAVISVPVMYTIRHSSRLNFEAHETQMLSDAAQEEIEKIKSTSIDDYINRVIASDSDYSVESLDSIEAMAPEQHDDAAAAATALAGEGYDASLTDPMFFKKAISVSGRDYEMVISIEPARYSDKTATNAANVNVEDLLEAFDADSSKYPLIRDELAKYETEKLLSDGGVSFYSCEILEALYNRLVMERVYTADSGAAKKAALEAIADKCTKDVDITVTESKNPSDEHQFEVRMSAEVTYTCNYTDSYGNPGTASYTYTVYDNTFAYETESYSKAFDEGMNYIPDGEHAYAFIFASAFEPLAIPSPSAGAGAHAVNNISIVRNGDTGLPLDIILVRTRAADPATTEYNFDSVTVGGSSYMVLNGAAPLGEATISGGTFYTNIKDTAFLPTVTGGTVGIGKKKTRSCYISVGIYSNNGGTYEREAFVESAKVER